MRAGRVCSALKHTRTLYRPTKLWPKPSVHVVLPYIHTGDFPSAPMRLRAYNIYTCIPEQLFVFATMAGLLSENSHFDTIIN